MIQNIKLENIHSSPWNARKYMDEAVIKDLADSILQVGMMQIPLGRMQPGGRVQLAFGQHRLAAYKLLTANGHDGYAEFPVSLVDYTDEQMAIAAFSENDKRKDLNPLERAQAVQKMIEDFEWNQQQVADKLNLDRSTISNMVRLLKMPSVVQDDLRDGILSQRSAMALLPWYELTPLELAVINKKCPEAEDFISLARNGQVQSDAIRQTLEEYLRYLKPDDEPRSQPEIQGTQEKTTNDQPSEWVKSEPLPEFIPNQKPKEKIGNPVIKSNKGQTPIQKAPEPMQKLEPQTATVGAVTEGEILLTVKWSAIGVLVGMQKFGSAPVIKFVKELRAADLPAMLNEIGIQ